MSEFAVATFYDAVLAVGARRVEAVVWVRACAIEEPHAGVSLRVWTPAGAAVAALREVAPAAGSLLHRAMRVDERSVDYDAGGWTDGAREFDLAVDVPARAADDEMLAARVSVVADGEVRGSALVAVTWSAGAGTAADADAAGTEAAAADMPTGPSPQPRHTPLHGPRAGDACPDCGLRTGEGDRYCEQCGRELVGANG